MRDHVVQVARDPAPLLGHRRALAPLALTLDEGRLALQLRRPPRPPAQRERGERGPAQHDGALQQVAGVEADVPLHDDREGREPERDAGEHVARVILRADGPEREQQRRESRRLAAHRLARERQRGLHAEDERRGREREAAAQQQRQRVEQHGESEQELRSRHVGDPELDLGDDRETDHQRVEHTRAPALPGRLVAGRRRRGRDGVRRRVERELDAHEEAASRPRPGVEPATA